MVSFQHIKIASSKTSKVRIDINDSCDALDANQYTSRPTWRGHGISIRPRGAASARLSMMKQAAREGRVFVVRYIHDSNRHDGDRQDHDTATAGYGALRASLANADAIAVGAASPRCGVRCPAPRPTPCPALTAASSFIERLMRLRARSTSSTL